MTPRTRTPGMANRSSGIDSAPVSLRPKAFLAATLSVSCLFSLGIELPASAGTPFALAKDKKSKQDPALKGLPVTELSVDEAVLHAMNRLAYGPRPGDVERVKQLGLAKWIDQQLAPNSIDDKAANARLENLPTLGKSTARLIEEYPQPKQAEKQAAKREQTAANTNPNARADKQPGVQNQSGAQNQNETRAAENAGAAVADAAPVMTPPSSSAAVGQSAQSDSPDMSAADKASVPASMKSEPSKTNPEVAGNPATQGGGGKRNVLSG